MVRPVLPYLKAWRKVKSKSNLLGMKAFVIPRIMMVIWEYIFYEIYSFIFIRPVPYPPFILLLYIYIFFLKNIIFSLLFCFY